MFQTRSELTPTSNLLSFVCESQCKSMPSLTRVPEEFLELYTYFQSRHHIRHMDRLQTQMLFALFSELQKKFSHLFSLNPFVEAISGSIFVHFFDFSTKISTCSAGSQSSIEMQILLANYNLVNHPRWQKVLRCRYSPGPI